MEGVRGGGRSRGRGRYFFLFIVKGQGFLSLV